jgi:hypothetical protein
MKKREKKINGILKFAKGEKFEKHYLRFLDGNGNPDPLLPVKEINGLFDVVVQFVDFSGKNKGSETPV